MEPKGGQGQRGLEDSCFFFFFPMHPFFQRLQYTGEFYFSRVKKITNDAKIKQAGANKSKE